MKIFPKVLTILRDNADLFKNMFITFYFISNIYNRHVSDALCHFTHLKKIVLKICVHVLLIYKLNSEILDSEKKINMYNTKF